MLGSGVALLVGGRKNREKALLQGRAQEGGEGATFKVGTGRFFVATDEDRVPALPPTHEVERDGKRLYANKDSIAGRAGAGCGRGGLLFSGRGKKRRG